jgi:hypothetical protein
MALFMNETFALAIESVGTGSETENDKYSFYCKEYKTDRKYEEVFNLKDIYAKYKIFDSFANFLQAITGTTPSVTFSDTVAFVVFGLKTSSGESEEVTFNVHLQN